MKLFGWLKPVGRFLAKVLNLIDTYVTEEYIDLALTLAREAAVKFDTNVERREYVVKILVARGVPEHIARLALEMAVMLLKKG